MAPLAGVTVEVGSGGAKNAVEAGDTATARGVEASNAAVDPGVKTRRTYNGPTEYNDACVWRVMEGLIPIFVTLRHVMECEVRVTMDERDNLI